MSPNRTTPATFPGKLPGPLARHAAGRPVPSPAWPRERAPRRFAALPLLLLLLMAAAPPAPCHAERAPILLDGTYGDWDGITPIHQDPQGDGGVSGIDFGNLWAADDDRFLFLRLEVGGEIQLDENNSLVLYLDTDANSSTGFAIAGIGAELVWELGQRTGTYRYGGQAFPVEQSDLRFRAFPTVSATEFEIGLGRDVLPDGAHPLFLGPTTRILFHDTASGGDWIPNPVQIAAHTFDSGTLPPEVAVPIGQQEESDLRLLTWNVHNDSPWDAGLQPKFRRILQAVQPKILDLQEIYNHTPAQTAALIESFLPSGPGEAWYAAGNNDCITVSRYPVLDTWPLDGNLAVLLNTNDVLGAQLLLINAHLPCCTNDAGRQREVDHILSFLRDAQEPGGQIDLSPDTPYAITGDMNFVGLSQQLTSLITGDIVDNGTYGPDFAPDWDGTDLTDVISRQTEQRIAYSWRSDTSDFWPGRLDFVIYTDHVLEMRNHYVLYPPDMSPDSLAAYGLQSGDAPSDHLPHCVDFRPAGPPVAVWDGGGRDGQSRDGSEGRADGSGASGLRWTLQPNPSSGGAVISLESRVVSSLRIQVYDAAGRWVAGPRFLFGPDDGQPTLIWDGRDDAGRILDAGAYFIRLSGRSESGEIAGVRRWIKVR